MKTLILIDVQRDFMPSGALGVAGADQIIPIINQLMPHFDHVLATQDWHPPHHVSFASAHCKKEGEKIHIDGVEQILWPDHCIQNTQGADFALGLHREKIEISFHKGTDLKVDSYSAFFDNARRHRTGLANHLHKLRVKDLYFVGVATDYCVLYSVLDALELGFNAWVIHDACRAVGLHSGDEARALQKMQAHGAKIIRSEDLISF